MIIAAAITGLFALTTAVIGIVLPRILDNTGLAAPHVTQTASQAIVMPGATHVPTSSQTNMSTSAPLATPTITITPSTEPSETPILEETATLSPTLTASPTPSVTPSVVPALTDITSPSATFTSTKIPRPTLSPSALLPTTTPIPPLIQARNGVEYAFVTPGQFSDNFGTSSDGFWISLYEITNAQFLQFMRGRGNFDNLSSEGALRLNASGGSQIQLMGAQWQLQQGYENYPVVGVSWYGARDYCQWIGTCLPTETEWRKAALWNPVTKQTSDYPWGDNTPTSEQANIDSQFNSILPVGSFPSGQSPSGVYDMIGNVWEWVSDRRGVNYFRMGGAWDTTLDLFGFDLAGYSLPSDSGATRGVRCAYS